MSKKNKKTKQIFGVSYWNILKSIGVITLLLFVLSLFSVFYDFISQNAMTILAISGGILTILIIIGAVSTKRVRKSIKRKLN